MTISYDPDRIPETPPEVFEEAEALRMHVVNVLCAERDSQVGDPGALSFTAMVPFLPRHGDRIELSDGTLCEVVRARFRVVGKPDADSGNKCWSLVPNVVAYKIQS